MIDLLINILGSAYSIPGFLVALYLVVVKGPKAVRWFLRNFAGTWQDWLFLPLIALPTFFATAVGLSLASALWPVTGFFLVREEWKKRRELKRVRTEEFESLLGKIKEDQEEPAGHISKQLTAVMPHTHSVRAHRVVPEDPRLAESSPRAPK